MIFYCNSSAFICIRDSFCYLIWLWFCQHFLNKFAYRCVGSTVHSYFHGSQAFFISDLFIVFYINFCMFFFFLVLVENLNNSLGAIRVLGVELIEDELKPHLNIVLANIKERREFLWFRSLRFSEITSKKSLKCIIHQTLTVTSCLAAHFKTNSMSLFFTVKKRRLFTLQIADFFFYLFAICMLMFS